MTTPSDQTPAGVAEETQPATAVDEIRDALRMIEDEADHANRVSIPMNEGVAYVATFRAIHAAVRRVKDALDPIADLQSRLTAAEERERKLVEALREALGASVLAKDEILRAALLAGSKG